MVVSMKHMRGRPRRAAVAQPGRRVALAPTSSARRVLCPEGLELGGGLKEGYISSLSLVCEMRCLRGDS